jgi:hypothetical protein
VKACRIGELFKLTFMHNLSDHNEFDFPIVETEYSLKRKCKDIFIQNKDMFILDLGENTPIYKWFVNPKISIEHYNVLYFTEKLISDVANAYKQAPEATLRKMLVDVAVRLKNISKGSVINPEGYDTIINQSLHNKDIKEVEPNDTIRFLENPYYRFEDYKFKNKNELKKHLISEALGKEKTDRTYYSISNTIADYDLNNGKITKKILSELSGVSLSTVKSYLKNNKELNFMFLEIERNSRTLQQETNLGYNKKKQLVKRLTKESRLKNLSFNILKNRQLQG